MFSTDFNTKKLGSTMLRLMMCCLIFTTFTTVITAQGPGGALACNNSVQVSLDDECEADITPGMILEGEDEDNLDEFVVSIEGITGTIVTVPGTYKVTVTSTIDGNSCWGFINVEDKLAPSVEECACPPGNTDPDCEFLCTDLDGILNGTVITPAPVVEENCSGLVSEHYDEVSNGVGCGQKVITRTWIFTDDAGNESTGCVQEFTLQPVDLGDVKEPTSLIEVPCGTDVSMPGLVAYFTPLVGSAMANMNAYPTVDGQPLTQEICNLVVTKSDHIVPVCDQACSNSIKVLRDWTVLDWCAGEAKTFTQIIKAADQEAPTVIAADITVTTDPWECVGNFTLPAPTTLTDNCTDFVTYTVTGPAGVVITYDNSLGLYTASGAPKGPNTFTYVATDCCNNEGVDPVRVLVVDKTAPVAVAKEFVTMTLTQGGIGKVFAPSIDNGSHDGCTDVHIEIRRDTDNCNIIGNTTYNNDGHPQDSPTDPDDGAFVKFCCADVNALEADVDGDGELDRGYIKVWMRVWDDGDMNGVFGSTHDNYNETWAFVKVEDKLTPTITCPDDITIQCDDDEDDLDLVGSAFASGACDDVPVTYTDSKNLNDCGIGVITRTWRVTSASQVRCIQRIYKDGDSFTGNNINFPNSYTTNCVDLDDDGQEPTWSAPPCAQVGYSVKSDTFVVEEDACLKIINQWTVVDWCQYDPNDQFPVGIWSDTQIIKVKDDIDPVIMNCADTMFPVDENCELRNPMLTMVASDNGDCSSKWLKWTALVDLYGDGTYDYEFSASLPSFDNSFNDTNGNGIPDRYLAPTSSGEEVKITLPTTVPNSMANHKVKWKVSDGCGNVDECLQNFMITDKKNPTPYCIGISSALMENGMVELWACDFDLGSFDNCTAQEDLRFTFTDTRPSQDPSFIDELGCSAMAFTCEDIATSNEIILDVYVWDEKNNKDFCTVILTLVDNQGACVEDGAQGRIAGTVLDAAGSPVSDIDVTLETQIADLTRIVKTDDEGAYAFSNLATNLDYQVTAQHDEDYRNGVNTLDLVMIQRHILGLETFDDAYKTIAADVTNDERVTPADLLALRKLILGINDDYDQESYLLLDAQKTYEDVMDPWPIDMAIELDNMAGEMMDQNLVMIKVGDVNRDGSLGLKSYNEEIANRSKATLRLASQQSEGKTIIAATHPANIAGLQMVIDLQGAALTNVTSQTLAISSDMYTVNAGMLYISWAGTELATLTDGEELFTIHTDGDVALTENTIMANEAYVGDKLSVVDIAITNRSTDTELAYDLSQNEPNPFKQVTNINYSVPTAGQVSIAIYDLSGKQVSRETMQAAQGQNTYKVDMKAAATGVYYYTLKASNYTATKKMILID